MVVLKGENLFLFKGINDQHGQIKSSSPSGLANPWHLPQPSLLPSLLSMIDIAYQLLHTEAASESFSTPCFRQSFQSNDIHN